jgi:hypothetical protein
MNNQKKKNKIQKNKIQKNKNDKDKKKNKLSKQKEGERYNLTKTRRLEHDKKYKSIYN